MPWVSFSCDNLQWDLHQLTRNRWNLVLFKILDLVQCLCECQDCFFIFLKWVLVKVEPWCSTLDMTLLFQTKVGWKLRFLTFQMRVESAYCCLKVKTTFGWFFSCYIFYLDWKRNWMTSCCLWDWAEMVKN